ncbi:peptidase M20 [Acidianus hospitalis W1]|uniref:Peptidase M20 n=1 Tax=Acidianus hospitalis (strain W1) TaxID=933801 RepID=F4B5R3_ACIHW|nr:M20/M25/M40 family metallo-hydrolase [Acidianus hospitalis]AEE93278.1 peptidase M20 [Acidianus hospitalis W1]
MEFSKEELDFFLSKYQEFLKIPSISATGEGIRNASSWLKEFMEELGIKTEIVETKGHPVVYGKVNNGGSKTLLVYNHYDVQPVDPINEWKYPPFSATISDGYIFARGASDNKGTLIARLLAFSKYKGKLNFNFVFEGEEEIGSIHLNEFIQSRKEELSKSSAVIMEGAGLDTKGRPMIVLGVKGLVYVQITVRVGERDVHSSVAPLIKNPVWELIKILNTIYDGEKVKIEGFYEDIEPLSKEVEELLDKIELDVEEYRKSLGVYSFNYKDRKEVVKALYTYPSCNIDGIFAGYIGQGSKTIVPSYAMAKMDFRLVPKQDPEKIYRELEKIVKAMGGEIVEMGLEKPVRTSPNTAVVKAMISSAVKAYSKDPVILPNAAGTQPMGLFYDLGIKEIVSAIGVGTPSSNAHAPNENVKLENFYKAIEHSLYFYQEYESLG